MKIEKKILNSLTKEWNKSGLESGDIVLIHSSLKKIFKRLLIDFNIKPSVDIILDSLLKAVGDEGTLLFPLFNFDFPESKFFDIRNTPSQMGILTEIARKKENAIRTGHPIYSFCALGKQSKEFQFIDNESGYGFDSPFAKIYEMDGKIAVIGLDDQNSMTSYHYIEECNKVDYRFHKSFLGVYINESGEKLKKTYTLYVRDIKRGVITDVNRMMNHLWSKGLYIGNKPHDGYGMRTIKFRSLYKETEKIIKSGNAENYLFSISKNDR